MLSYFRALALWTTLAILVAPTASAQSASVPTGEVVLTITGTVDKDPVVFDLAMLMELDATVIETATIWTEGKQVFQGVALDVLMDSIGVTQGTLLATAINDYTVEIPVSDAVAGGPIIAYKLNDATMSLRDKGPLWVVYPYDSSAAYRSEVIYSRSIWQLDRIEVVE
ncbi:oxidoreductase [Yoonia sediminilitoris]|uniref:Oxidoreductase molybdopterin-binding domain-containing protein n=1 Tax=Yoonia sediminilitoris TaxID=1286148 RepID=A0A2T6KFZ1_9RHOB|nr:oxidoreductase [Yoonia sediminilitoris]PUB14242.1 hypothetical protein C8N45_106116 [Yoonia sediminilitoris]RCW95173.1 hypothetical protein DFP92_106116 [Yoonia sediminilitoris]